MRIVCPNCELKGQVDAAPKGAKTRIACVRCATTFDAVLVDGRIQALLPQTDHDEATFSSTQGVVLKDGAEGAFKAETQDGDQFEVSRQVEASLLPVEDFSDSSQDLTPEAAVETAQAGLQEISEEFRPQSDEIHAHETAEAEEDSGASVQALKSLGTGKVNRPPTDAYGMGVRLMRVSPLWLLLAGLSFISFIVFCNWLIKPADPSAGATNLMAAASNRAPNQSARRVAAQTSNAQLTVNNQPVQPSNESGAAFVKADAKVAPTAAPTVEPVAAKPPVEEKPATSTPNPPNAAKDGKVTIQVGSYSAAAEADERVANLKSAGFEARSVAVEIPKRGTWYRVQSGRFTSREEAERYGKQLRDKGVVSSFITADVQE